MQTSFGLVTQCPRLSHKHSAEVNGTFLATCLLTSRSWLQTLDPENFNGHQRDLSTIIYMDIIVAGTNLLWINFHVISSRSLRQCPQPWSGHKQTKGKECSLGFRKHSWRGRLRDEPKECLCNHVTWYQAWLVLGWPNTVVTYFMHVLLNVLPAISTDSVYLYLLNVRYSLISSLINKFSLERTGLASDWNWTDLTEYRQQIGRASCRERV